jgi:hypothetical protein
MTVKVTKPALNLREKLSELDKPSGIAGQDILKADTPQEVFNYIGAGRRNLIINGAMQVAQRGTSVSVSDGTNEGYQSLDRFSFTFGNNAGGACTISQDTTVPSGQGFSNSYKVAVTTADTNISSTHQIYFRQSIEAQDIRNSGWDYTGSTGSTGNSKLTVSFWARSSKAGIYCLCLRNNDASGNMYYVKEYTLEADTWKRVICSVPSNPSLVFSNNNDTGLEVNWSLQTGTNRDNATDGAWNTADTSRATSNQVNFFDSTSNVFYLTGVQLEVGSVATPFEHRSYGEELALCQRYFCKSFNDTAAPANQTSNAIVSNLVPYSSNDAWTNSIYFPVRMRAAPSITLYSSEDEVSSDNKWQYYDGSWNDATGNTPAFTTQTDFFVSVTATAQFTAYVPRLCKGHYTADAEL